MRNASFGALVARFEELQREKRGISPVNTVLNKLRGAELGK